MKQISGIEVVIYWLTYIFIFIMLINFFKVNTEENIIVCWVLSSIVGVFAMIITDFILIPFRWIKKVMDLYVSDIVKYIVYTFIIGVILKLVSVAIVINYYTEKVVF